jgi:hypothetical protein
MFVDCRTMIAKQEPSSNIKTHEDSELEEFIEGWHFDRKSRKLARDMASFLFQFYDYLLESGLSKATLEKHGDNLWAIGYLGCNYGYHKKFSPKIFLGGPNHVYEFERKFSDTNYAVKSYEGTYRKLAKYVQSLNEGSTR